MTFRLICDHTTWAWKESFFSCCFAFPSQKKSESGIERRPVEGVSDIKPRHRGGAQAFELDSYFVNLVKKFFVSAVREPARERTHPCEPRRKLVLQTVWISVERCNKERISRLSTINLRIRKETQRKIKESPKWSSFCCRSVCCVLLQQVRKLSNYTLIKERMRLLSLADKQTRLW